jgi:hypothetical protein
MKLAARSATDDDANETLFDAALLRNSLQANPVSAARNQSAADRLDKTVEGYFPVRVIAYRVLYRPAHGIEHACGQRCD